jgi:hypothetical protein
MGLQGSAREPGNFAFLSIRGGTLLCLTIVFGVLTFATSMAVAQPAVEAFHWIDFHDAKDAPTVTWVTQALKAEKWTAIREIGVQWDSALVVTSQRATPQSTPPSDVYTVWSVSLSKHAVQPLLHGVNPRILNWTTFGGGSQTIPELGLVYDDCSGCDAASTFFTTLYYNFTDHAWRGRWMRGDQAAALWSAGTVDGVVRTQVYGLLTEPPGRAVLGTWSHNDYGKAKPAEDFVFEYSVDPATGLEQTQGLSGKHAEEMEQRLCRADPGQVDPALAELARGQDSELCRNLGQPSVKGRPGRRPTTTPPANNHGQSTPPGSGQKANPKATPQVTPGQGKP